MYIIDYLRSPHVFSYGKFHSLSPVKLSARVILPLLDRHPNIAENIDQVIVGNVAGTFESSNMARTIALECGLTNASGITINKNCASSLEAIQLAKRMIDGGEADLIVVGGVESFSRIPLVTDLQLSHLLFLLKRKSWKLKFSALKELLKLRLRHFSLIAPLQRGLIDSQCQLSLGELADILAAEFGIDKQLQDHFAYSSHQKARAAEDLLGYQSQIISILNDGKVIGRDDCIKSERSLSDFSFRPPYYPRSFAKGSVSSWNSSPICDGASYLLMASEKAVKQFQLAVRGKILAGDTTCTSPEKMGVAPFYSMNRLLEKQQLAATAIDCFEINEAFAAQMLANFELMKKNWQIDESFIQQRVNCWVCAIALGHHFGAT